jgi:hypothetical protein
MLLSSGITYRHSAYTAPSSSFLLPPAVDLDVCWLARFQAKIVSLVSPLVLFLVFLPVGIDPSLIGMGNANEGWKSVLQDETVIAKLGVVGREVAFVPGWFTRVERRRSEFAGTVQGDFNVGS